MTEEALPPAPPVSPRLARVRRLTRVMDAAVRIPGTRIRVGLDPLLGLVPWAGDVAGAVISGYLIWQSARLGAPWTVLSRMTLNVAFETVVGVLPLVGDVFDAGYRANSRNLALLERHLEAPGPSGLAARRFWLGVAGGLVAAVVGIALVAGWTLWWTLGLLGLV